MNSWYMITHRTFSIDEADKVQIEQTTPNDCKVHTDHYCCELITRKQGYLVAYIGRVGDKYIRGYNIENTDGNGGSASPCMEYDGLYDSIPLALISVLNERDARKQFGDKECDELIGKLSKTRRRAFVQLEIEW